MDRRRIGTTALEVTEISLGGASIGGLYQAVPRDTAETTIEAAWDADVRYFDTAPFYGFGLSERRMGDVLRTKPRESFVLSTKVGRLLRPVPEDQIPDYSYVDPLPFTVEYDYSYDGIMRSFEFSLARLGLNRIDLLFVHDIGAYTHGEDGNRKHFSDLMDSGFRALEQLKREGSIRAFGLGVNEVRICLDVMSRATIDCILLAGRYTLLDRAAGRDLLPLCEKTGTSLVVGGALNSGILATGPVPGAYFDYKPAAQDILERVGGMVGTAERHGVPLVAAALRFPLRDPRVATVLIGAAKPSLIRDNIDLAALAIPDAAWDEFDRDAINR
jgi:D-threo-aldose 1-dehydrogenase